MDPAHGPETVSGEEKRHLLSKLLREDDDLEGVPQVDFHSAIGRFFARRKLLPHHESGLLGGDAATVFDFLGRAWELDMYPYQTALEHRSGPRVRVRGRTYLMLSSYDYLGLIGDPRVDASARDAIDKYGTGTGGVRLLTGTVDLHHRLERKLARFKGMPSAVSFSNGYLANLGVIAALLGPSDRVLMDANAHRSLVDACKLANVPVRRFRHNDVESLRHECRTPPFGRRTLIIVDGAYSMDGDVCPLPDLVAVKQEFGAYLLVDDSHAFGVLGARGRGVDEHFGVAARRVDVWTASLAKAIPSNGGVALLSSDVSYYLQHAASPFIFSAALCPAAVAPIATALDIIDEEPERLERLRRNADTLRSGLRDLGYDTGTSVTPIIPVLLRDEANTVTAARRLRDLDVLATPVVYPAVPAGQARLRLCVTAAHTAEDIACALAAFRRLRTAGAVDLS